MPVWAPPKYRRPARSDNTLAGVLRVNADWNESCLSMLDKLKWMSIKDRIFYSTCLLMYKVTHNVAPYYLYYEQAD